MNINKIYMNINKIYMNISCIIVTAYKMQNVLICLFVKYYINRHIYTHVHTLHICKHICVSRKLIYIGTTTNYFLQRDKNYT